MFKRSKDKSKTPKAELTKEQKKHKWLRLVGVLLFRKYGTWIFGQLFYAFLFSEAISAMDYIWSEFSEVQDCQHNYIKSIASNVSAEYNEAAQALARSALNKAKCTMGTLDIDIPGPFSGSIKIGSLPAGLLDEAFGWLAPGRFDLPDVDLDIQSNSDEVIESVEDDISFLRLLSKWTKYTGYILAFISLCIIFGTATWIVWKNKVWKQTKTTLLMKAITLAQVALVYLVLMGIVFLQAYFTDKFCGVAITNAVLHIPECKVASNSCDFECESTANNYPSPCKKCDIKLHWWWAEGYALPNIFGLMYVIFLFVTVFVEWNETRRQKKELVQAERLKKIREEIAKRAQLPQRRHQHFKSRDLENGEDMEGLMNQKPSAPPL